jgi:cytochrome c oxidase subunit IV
MAASEETHAHGSPPRFYLTIGVILAVITAVEVAITLVGIERIILVPLLLVLSFAKGSCVVMFFMHLRGDARIFQFLFIVPLTIATSMILVFLALFSVHVGIAG